MNGKDIISNVVTERLKEHITHEQNGTNIMLVIQKQLFASDLAENQNRLSMPYNQLQTLDFLTPDERLHLDTRCYHEIDVPLLGPTLQLYEKPMKLVRWIVNSTECFVLRTAWINFVHENKNDLKPGATIQVWSYRKEDQNKLCFAIAVVNMPKKNIEPPISNDITERLKEHITHEQNGTNIMLVIQKKLFASDLAGNQNRLSMPYNQLQTFDFLTPDERTHLDTRCYHEIDVPLLGPTLQLYEKPMKLVRWIVNSTECFVLRTAWRNFVDENKNDLKIGSKIQVWSYRKDQQLCFAIAVVERAD